MTSDGIGRVALRAVAPEAVAAGRRGSGGGEFRRALEGIGQAVDRGERLVSRVAAGRGTRDLSPAELLALQAGIYRYGEAVDLAARLVDRAGAAARTVLQGNG